MNALATVAAPGAVEAVSTVAAGSGAVIVFGGLLTVAADFLLDTIHRARRGQR